MKKRTAMKKSIAFVMACALGLASLTACGGGSEYNGYASAYNKVTANGGMEAKFDVDLTMDGEKVEGDGNFKLDTSGDSNILYYEMSTEDNDIIQFSDGEYIYTQTGESKSKYKLGSKPTGGDSGKEEAKSSSGTFNTTAFLNEFSSFLEAGKIKAFADLHRRGIDAVVARIMLSYKTPLHSSDEFVVRTEVAKEGVRYVFHQDIVRLPDQKLCCRAKVDIVTVINGELSAQCPELDNLLLNDEN